MERAEHQRAGAGCTHWALKAGVLQRVGGIHADKAKAALQRSRDPAWRGHCQGGPWA